MLHSGKDAAPYAAQPPGSCSRGPEATGERVVSVSFAALGTSNGRVGFV